VNLRIAAIGGFAGALLAAGCSSGSSSGDAGSTVSPVPTPSHTHTSSPTPIPTTTTVTPTPTVTVTPPTGVPTCQSNQLSLSLGPPGGAAGSTYTPIVFTNTGSTTCELRGYPGVSFVNTSGARVGSPSKQDAGRIKTVKLASGHGANALLREPETGNYPPSACQAATSNRLQVYPPGETTPLFLSYHAKVCTTKSARTGIGPVSFGTGG
jgi:hypothetical protein